VFFPGLRGRQKKAFFNGIASWVVLAVALSGAGVGLLQDGVLGAIIGLGAALALGGSFAQKCRFYRR
jgi:hypothetical protein